MEKEIKRLDIINNISDVLAFLEKAKCVLNDLADKYFGEFYERGTPLPHEKQLQLAWEYRKAQCFNNIAFDYVWQASKVLNTLVNELDICPTDIKTYGSENTMFNIEQLRKRAGLSQVELAKALNITQGAVSQWENGISVPSSEKLPEIAKILGCEIGELFEKETE